MSGESILRSSTHWQVPGHNGLPAGKRIPSDDHRRDESLHGSADFLEAGKPDRVVCRIRHQVVEIIEERLDRIQLKVVAVPRHSRLPVNIHRTRDAEQVIDLAVGVNYARALGVKLVPAKNHIQKPVRRKPGAEYRKLQLGGPYRRIPQERVEPRDAGDGARRHIGHATVGVAKSIHRQHGRRRIPQLLAQAVLTVLRESQSGQRRERQHEVHHRSEMARVSGIHSPQVHRAYDPPRPAEEQRPRCIIYGSHLAVGNVDEVSNQVGRNIEKTGGGQTHLRAGDADLRGCWCNWCRRNRSDGYRAGPYQCDTRREVLTH